MHSGKKNGSKMATKRHYSEGKEWFRIQVSLEPRAEECDGCVRSSGWLSKAECIIGEKISSMFGNTNTFCNTVTEKPYNEVCARYYKL